MRWKQGETVKYCVSKWAQSAQFFFIPPFISCNFFYPTSLGAIFVVDPPYFPPPPHTRVFMNIPQIIHFTEVISGSHDSWLSLVSFLIRFVLLLCHWSTSAGDVRWFFMMSVVTDHADSSDVTVTSISTKSYIWT